MHSVRDRPRNARWQRPFRSRTGVGEVRDVRTSMPNKLNLRVFNPPPKPLLIWDGNCDFCGLWIVRWREMTLGKVDYTTYQKAADRFPEIPTDEFNRSLDLIEPEGRVVFAEEGVFRLLVYRRSRQLLELTYDCIP